MEIENKEKEQMKIGKDLIKPSMEKKERKKEETKRRKMK